MIIVYEKGTMIDKESKEFIKWSKKRDVHYDMLLALDWLTQYYSNIPAQEFNDALEQKKIKGQKEHGPINFDVKWIVDQLEQEAQDVVGWLQYLIYVNEKSDKAA